MGSVSYTHLDVYKRQSEECELFALPEVEKQVSVDNIDLQLNAKAAYMMDWSSGTEIYANNAIEQLPIASIDVYKRQPYKYARNRACRLA